MYFGGAVTSLAFTSFTPFFIISSASYWLKSFFHILSNRLSTK